jgi:GNAT superfamily N-acetyltransferase
MMMEWLAFNNPHAEADDTTYFIAELEDEIIAFHGHMPVRFNFGNRQEKAFHLHDLYVHKEYRDQGMGFWIVLALAEAIENQTKSFMCLFGMNPINLVIQRRMGYFETQTSKWVKLLNPEKQLRRSLKLPVIVGAALPFSTMFLKIIDQFIWWMRPGNTSQSKVVSVDRFDQRFDQLQTRIQSKLGISTVKDSAYLNWKYIDRPFKREQVFAIEENQEIKGFVVLSVSPYLKKYPQGLIVDIAADPDDIKTIHSLCKKAISFFKTEKKVHKINCLLTDQRFIKVLRKYLFVEQPGKALMLGNLEFAEEYEDALKDMSNWHLTYGESDAYMLSK